MLMLIVFYCLNLLCSVKCICITRLPFRCLLLCPSTPLRLPSILKCLQLPPPRTSTNPKETPQYIATKRSGVIRLSLIALAMFDIVLALQDREVLIGSLDLLMQTLDPLWGSTDMTVITAIQSLVSKLIELLPPPPSTDIGSLSTVTITANHSASDLFWIRISQVRLFDTQPMV